MDTLYKNLLFVVMLRLKHVHTDFEVGGSEVLAKL